MERHAGILTMASAVNFKCISLFYTEASWGPLLGTAYCPSVAYDSLTFLNNGVVVSKLWKAKQGPTTMLSTPSALAKEAS